MYDYLIVGSGLFGSVFARLAKDDNKKVLIIEKRNHIAGNCYTENKDNINVHVYGPHIFHTNNDEIWNFVNKYTTFNNYVNKPKVFYKDKIYSFPINLMTLHQLWGVTNPIDAHKKLISVRENIPEPKNLEEWCLSQIGKELYETFIKGYTQKQWKTDPKNLPSFIIKRLPIRLNFDENYYFDKYQGIPIGGYTKMFEKMLDGIEVKTNIDFLSNRDYWKSQAKTIVYTGKIDEYYDYCHGELEYRTTQFEHNTYEIEDYQGNAIINYTEETVPYTRVIEHKHFDGANTKHTIVTKEYPDIWNKTKIPYYPINNEVNNSTYEKYKNLTNFEKNVIFGGRLSEYKYYDMHQVIGSALNSYKKQNYDIK
jgi:UDP-galactopyranose mutase